MNKKGFTLAEMLAVIAVLGILVLLVVPNVLKNYREAKRIAFIDEAKTVYSKATDQYVLSRTKGNKIGLITNDNEYKLDIDNANDLEYFVRINDEGVVTQFRLTNREFCIVGTGDFLGNYSKDDVIDMTDETQAGRCVTSALVDDGVYALKLQTAKPIVSEADPRTIYLKYNVGWFKNKSAKTELDRDENGKYKVTIPYRKNNYFKNSSVTRQEGETTVKIKAINCDGTLAAGNTGDGLFTGTETSNEIFSFSEFEPKYYQIKFELNNGTGSITTLKVPYGVQKNLPVNKDSNGYGINIKRTGFLFKGWTSGGVTYADGAALPVLTDDNEDEYPHFKFDNVSVCKNGLDSANTNIIPFEPIWEASTYTVKYDGNTNTGGSKADSVETYDRAFNLPNNVFTKSGYTFTGWTATGIDTSTAKHGTSNNPNTAWNGTTKTKDTYFKNLTPVRDAEVTMKANWEANKFTIAYDGNGSDSGSTASHECTYDADCNLSNNGFTRTGYVFDKWVYSGTTYSQGDSVKNITTTPNATITFKATWIDKCSSIAYVDGTSCTVSCGGGTYNRVAYSSYDSNYRCPASDTSSGGSACQTQDCCSSTYTSYGSWGNYGSCSKTCGGGLKYRSRSYTYYSNYNGQNCGSGTESESASCNTQSCCTPQQVIPWQCCTTACAWYCCPSGSKLHSDGTCWYEC